MTLARGSQALKDLGPSRPPRRRGSGYCCHHLCFAPGQGPGEGWWEEPSPTPGSSGPLPETRSDENVFLQIKPSQDSPSGAGSEPGALGASPGGGAGAAAAARAQHPSLRPPTPPPAHRVGRLRVGGWSPPTNASQNECQLCPSSAPLGLPKVSPHPSLLYLLPVGRPHPTPGSRGETPGVQSSFCSEIAVALGQLPLRFPGCKKG